PAVIARILAAVDLRHGDAAVEIGPGHGALTAGLLQAAGRLDAIEIDRDLAAALGGRLAAAGAGAAAAAGALQVHVADALQFDWNALAAARGARLRLVGNLPYNVSTPLLFRLLQSADAIADMHFMLQKEVVDRIVAAPGTPAYGRLTVMLAPRVSSVRVLDVGPGAFRPAPKVASSVVRLCVIESPRPVSPLYAPLVAAAFSQRRKTLRNALRAYLSAEQIGALGLDPGGRAEQLAPLEFARLAEAAALLRTPALAQAPAAVLH
ncbi:MAG: 16S rRNA (adenine(1518)-N(6)/adenine(1519)-N(6))-dimethyltransferase RsmA, partial [Steroidobacteraceae bacterium]